MKVKMFPVLFARVNGFLFSPQNFTGNRIEKAIPRVHQPPVVKNQPPALSLRHTAKSDQPVVPRIENPAAGVAKACTTTETTFSDEHQVEIMLQVWNPHMSSENLEKAVAQITNFMKDPAATRCDLSGLGIKALPVYFPFKEALSERCTHLNLSGNQLDELPENFLFLKNSLVHLDLSDNPIKHLPDWCYGISQRTFSEKVRAAVKPPHQEKPCRSSLEELILDKTDITKLSKRIRNHVHLKELSIRDTRRLRYLPNEISHLSKLEHLRIAGTKIISIQPLSPTLTGLDASNTPLNALPSNIEQLKNLETLNLSSTHVKILPDGFGELPLKTLDLSNNPQIKRLSNCIFSLRNLVTLNCKNNKNLRLTDEEIENLKRKVKYFCL